jgi:hypothetical protein
MNKKDIIEYTPGMMIPEGYAVCTGGNGPELIKVADFKPVKTGSRIAVGCNLLTHQNSIAYGSHTQMWYWLGRNTDHTYVVNFPRRMSIDNMRNQTASLALSNDCEYLFFYDDDVILPKESVARLIQTAKAEKADVVAGLTYIRSHPYAPMAFKFRSDDPDSMRHLTYEEIEGSESDIIPCDAIGFSTVLISVALLRKLETPYFLTGPNFTEDVYFCCKVKDRFPDTKIILDRNVQTDHIIGDYTISHKNHELVRKFDEDVFDAKPQNGDFDPSDIESTADRLKSQGNS